MHLTFNGTQGLDSNRQWRQESGSKSIQASFKAKRKRQEKKFLDNRRNPFLKLYLEHKNEASGVVAAQTLAFKEDQHYQRRLVMWWQHRHWQPKASLVQYEDIQAKITSNLYISRGGVTPQLWRSNECV